MTFFKAFNENDFNLFKTQVAHIETNEEELRKSYNLINELNYNDYDNYIPDLIAELEDVRKELGVPEWSETSLYEMLLWVIMKRVSRKISRVTGYNLIQSWVIAAGVTGYEPFSVSVTEEWNYFFGVETLKQLHNALAKTPKDKHSAVYWHKDVIWFLREIKLLPKD